MSSGKNVPRWSLARRPHVCLAASGGGHLRQLLDLEPVWRKRSFFFVTEDSALARSLAESHMVYTVEHFAVGQARLGKPLRMLRAAIANLRRSWNIIRDERPDYVITTGAGAMFWVTLLARLRGAHVILIDSFARFRAPSKFATVTRVFANDVVVQSPLLKRRWPDALLFDPLRILKRDLPTKQPLLFATVGATLPFPRLVEAVLALKASGRLEHRVLLQIGDGEMPTDVPEDVEIVRTIGFDRVRALLEEADIVVCHAGTGSLITGLAAGCHVIAMPRRFDLGEHYDDHQQEITAAFAQRGLISVAREASDLDALVASTRGRGRVVAKTDPVPLMSWLEQTIPA